MIKVTTMGGETKKVDYKGEGMTVADVLEKAEIEATDKATISVNGEDAMMETIVADEALVVITPNISNG